MKKAPIQKIPSALACGLLEDGNRALFLLRQKEAPSPGKAKRALFLSRKETDGAERIELPSVLVYSGDNPVLALASEFRRQTGIDGEVHEVTIESRQNAGSKKRKAWIPVLVFRVTAKSARAAPSAEFSGFCWLERRELAGKMFGRNLAWMHRHGQP